MIHYGPSPVGVAGAGRCGEQGIAAEEWNRKILSDLYLRFIIDFFRLRFPCLGTPGA
jgi:hypothetical protein